MAFSDLADCLCQMMLCFGLCYLCKSACGCNDPDFDNPTVIETDVVEQPLNEELYEQTQGIIDANQEQQWKDQEEKRAYYPTHQNESQQTNGYLPQVVGQQWETCGGGAQSFPRYNGYPSEVDTKSQQQLEPYNSPKRAAFLINNSE